MMSKRKRATRGPDSTEKRRKIAHSSQTGSKPSPRLVQQFLAKYYHNVRTLRDYLLSALPASSRVRRRRLLSFIDGEDHIAYFQTTLVGLLQETTTDALDRRHGELCRFTQTHKRSQRPSATSQQLSIDEAVDFAIWSLFKTCTPAQRKPNHILCHGLDRSVTVSIPGVEGCRPLLPGIIERHSNLSRDELTNPVWRELIAHLGADGERIITTLLLDYGIFVRIDHGIDNFRQLSGVPIHDLDPRGGDPTKRTTECDQITRKPSDIKFVRSRILYGQPVRNQEGKIQFGLKQVHILNRLSDSEDHAENRHVMRYVFPRQFKLHNVFVSLIDRKETAQAFKDYTVRDEEFSRASSRFERHMPRRLRGKPNLLVQRLRQAHRVCSYNQLVYHCCPVSFPPATGALSTDIAPFDLTVHTTSYRTQLSQTSSGLPISKSNVSRLDCDDSSFLPYSTCPNQVSVFCRSVVSKIVPHEFLGTGEESTKNWQQIMHNIDKFVHMRKFETLNLHEVFQGLKMRTIDWLAPASAKLPRKAAISDTQKRGELLQEFLYYLFDSILIPLVSSNFYVTESGIHRNHLLYFRHDVWERLCQPTLATLRLDALLPLTKTQLRQASNPAEPWYSIVRLLPKEAGARTIANLRRRAVSTIDGKRVLAQSINTRLIPLFNIFNYERHNDIGVFKSSSLSVEDVGPKLSGFKERLLEQTPRPLYFVKVDIQSAFDSIPQGKLLDIVNQIFKNNHYSIIRHAEGKYRKIMGDISQANSMFRFVKSAHPTASGKDIITLPLNVLSKKKSVVFSDIDQHQMISASQAKAVLQQHVQCNMIKVGGDFYRKSKGIAQGSILSSLLCTFFYNDFEMSRLGFLDATESILLRVMDDFLLITTNRSDAERFMTAMKAGDMNYGIRVHPEKSLVNFDMTMDGIQVPKVEQPSHFPFCGLFIDTATLQVSKNRKRKDNVIANSLTVDIHGKIGAKFRRRILSSLRIQFQVVLYHPSLNDKMRVAHTLVESIQETTMKMHQYYISIPAPKRPSQRFLIDLTEQLMKVAAQTVLDRSQGGDVLTRSQIHCLTAAGMLKILESRNSLYSTVLAWLRNTKASLVHSLDMSPEVVKQLVDRSFGSVQHYIF